MTREEYNQRMEELREQEIKIASQKKEVQEEYRKSVNKPYEHLLHKKVTVIYEYQPWATRDIEEKTAICYWGGYYLEYGDFRPGFYQIKKDGSMSSRELYLRPHKIISMEECL